MTKNWMAEEMLGEYGNLDHAKNRKISNISAKKYLLCKYYGRDPPALFEVYV